MQQYITDMQCIVQQLQQLQYSALTLNTTQYHKYTI
jgi:hypothetical protein